MTYHEDRLWFRAKPGAEVHRSAEWVGQWPPPDVLAIVTDQANGHVRIVDRADARNDATLEWMAEHPELFDVDWYELARLGETPSARFARGGLVLITDKTAPPDAIARRADYIRIGATA